MLVDPIQSMYLYLCCCTCSRERWRHPGRFSACLYSGAPPFAVGIAVSSKHSYYAIVPGLLKRTHVQELPRHRVGTPEDLHRQASGAIRPRAGNGGCNLDDPMWDGWFDRTERDSGAIIVGGGASPLSGHEARSWFPGGSCYGDRVDVQAWYDNIVTASASDGAPRFVDLFYPDADGRQAYTAQFGGTSGASPMIASIAAALNGVMIEQRGQPMDPMDIRAAMVSTGHPQPDGHLYPIGPQPDLRRLLRIWGVR